MSNKSAQDVSEILITSPTNVARPAGVLPPLGGRDKITLGDEKTTVVASSNIDPSTLSIDQPSNVGEEQSQVASNSIPVEDASHDPKGVEAASSEFVENAQVTAKSLVQGVLQTNVRESVSDRNKESASDKEEKVTVDKQEATTNESKAGDVKNGENSTYFLESNSNDNNGIHSAKTTANEILVATGSSSTAGSVSRSPTKAPGRRGGFLPPPDQRTVDLVSPELEADMAKLVKMKAERENAKKKIVEWSKAFENEHGRVPTSDEKKAAKPLYEELKAVS